MALSQAALNASISWTLTKTNTGFGNTSEGPDSLSFNLNGLNTTTFNQIYPARLSITSGSSTTVDLTSLTNLINESFGFGHALALVVSPTGSGVSVSPGASNGLTWFFGGTSPSHTVKNGGILIHSDPVAGPGQVVDSTHKNLTFTETGGADLTLKMVILGGTT